MELWKLDPPNVAGVSRSVDSVPEAKNPFVAIAHLGITLPYCPGSLAWGDIPLIWQFLHLQ